MAATSTEFGGWFADGQGHEIAQGYGLFLWAGVVLYATVAWRVWARRSEPPSPPSLARVQFADSPVTSLRRRLGAGRPT